MLRPRDIVEIISNDRHQGRTGPIRPFILRGQWQVCIDYSDELGPTWAGPYTSDQLRLIPDPNTKDDDDE